MREQVYTNVQVKDIKAVFQ